VPLLGVAERETEGRVCHTDCLRANTDAPGFQAGA